MPAEKQNETIRIEKEDRIAWVILNRPEKRNAMSPQLHREMDAALDDLATDPDSDILVLTGAGDAFCAGQDIRLFFREAGKDPAAAHRARQASSNWRWRKLSTFPKPTIAMINGYCFGGAFTQACACDFAICRRRSDLRSFGSELGHSARRHRVVERGAGAELPRRALLRHDRRHLRRQEGEGDGLRQFLGAEGGAPEHHHRARHAS